VEGVPHVDAQGGECSAGGDPLRQVPDPDVPRRSDEPGPQAGDAEISVGGRRFIKGQKYALLSHWGNLTTDGKEALRLLFHANARLNKAYLLKESFGQLWDYKSPAWARKFFDQLCYSPRWQRWQPFRKFAQLVESHWDGIEADCREENKLPLGFVEGLNNKIRVIQRRAYGFRDEDCLRLSILTCMLTKL
jgi:transposase